MMSAHVLVIANVFEVHHQFHTGRPGEMRRVPHVASARDSARPRLARLNAVAQCISNLGFLEFLADSSCSSWCLLALRSPRLDRNRFLMTAKKNATIISLPSSCLTIQVSKGRPLASVCTLRSLGPKLHHEEHHGVAANHEDSRNPHVTPADLRTTKLDGAQVIVAGSIRAYLTTIRRVRVQ